DPQSTHDAHQLCLSNTQNAGHSNDVSGANNTKSPETASPVIQSPSPARGSPIGTHSTQSADLNTIFNTLKPFSGENEQYSLFITRFNSLVHTNPSIDTITKQNILISLLEGDAKDLITSDELSEGAYEELRTNLEKVYNRKNDRRKQLIESYRNLPFHQSDYEQMDKDVMKHVCLTNSLQKCQVSINDPFLIDTFVDKLPIRIMRSFIKQTRNSTPSFLEASTLVQTLISENRALDDAEQRKKNRTQLTEICTAEVNKLSISAKSPRNNESRHKQSRPPKPSKWRSAPCTFCQQNHPTNTCQIPAKEKRDSIMKQNLCLNCLRNDHLVSDCQSRFRCNTCNRKHHSVICQENEKLEKLDTLVNCVNTNENLKTFFRNNGVDL
ncbi:hypothetical protein CRE_27986, partial [Caenorhabditis remanei]